MHSKTVVSQADNGSDGTGRPRRKQAQDSGQQPEKAEKKRLSFWRTFLSVLQASFGVQSQKNKERDFESGSIPAFILAAVIFMALFVAIIATVVSLVLGAV